MQKLFEVALTGRGYVLADSEADAMQTLAELPTNALHELDWTHETLELTDPRDANQSLLDRAPINADDCTTVRKMLREERMCESRFRANLTWKGIHTT